MAVPPGPIHSYTTLSSASLSLSIAFFNALSILSLGIIAALALFKQANSLLLTLGSKPPAIFFYKNMSIYELGHERHTLPLAAETISNEILE